MYNVKSVCEASLNHSLRIVGFFSPFPSSVETVWFVVGGFYQACEKFAGSSRANREPPAVYNIKKTWKLESTEKS